jgi:hypothetical protein
MPRIASSKSSGSSRVQPAPAPFHSTASPGLTYSVPVVARPTLGQSIKDGFGLGIGSSIARNLVDGWFHKPAPVAAAPVATTVQPTAVVPSGVPVATELQKKEYIQCMQTINDQEYCKKLMEELH